MFLEFFVIVVVAAAAAAPGTVNTQPTCTGMTCAAVTQYTLVHTYTIFTMNSFCITRHYTTFMYTLLNVFFQKYKSLNLVNCLR